VVRSPARCRVRNSSSQRATDDWMDSCRYVTAENVLERERSKVAQRISFDDYVRDQQAGLVRYAALLAGSRAQGEDLVQDVLVRLYPRWAQLSEAPGNLHAYVRRAVTNEHLSWRRRWSTRHIHVAEIQLLEGELDDPWIEGPDEDLWAGLRRLPGQQRAAVVLRYYVGLTDSEIGAALSCREGTVRGHISRGLATLRRSLSGPNGAGQS
jgi:RNA polymerase sigma-70 factor (sigma-E family)